ncbi:hypothetical protein HKX48_004702 [Thoreauomyces humboldtii]|nr:hypothetical protein HKX48_004702 [Thoreauomyces humboldtii]
MEDEDAAESMHRGHPLARHGTHIQGQHVENVDSKMRSAATESQQNATTYVGQTTRKGHGKSRSGQREGITTGSDSDSLDNASTPSAMQAISGAKPRPSAVAELSKPQRRLSKKGFLKPQSPRKIATRTNIKFVDPDLATDIDNHLIHQVRALHQDLGISNDQKRDLHERISALETELDGMRKQNQKHSYVAGKQEEKIWDLELQNQQLLEHATKSDAECAQLMQKLRQLDSVYRQTVDEMDDLKNVSKHQSEEFDHARARLEADLVRHRDMMSTLETQNLHLMQVGSETTLADQRASTSSDDSVGKRPEALQHEQPIRPESPTPSSLPASPQRSPTKQTYFLESLSSSLTHAHEQISILEDDLRESEQQRGQLAHLLAEAQETIETLQEYGTATPPETVTVTPNGGVATFTKIRTTEDGEDASGGTVFVESVITPALFTASILPVSTVDTPRKVARNLQNEFKAAALDAGLRIVPEAPDDSKDIELISPLALEAASIKPCTKDAESNTIETIVSDLRGGNKIEADFEKIVARAVEPDFPPAQSSSLDPGIDSARSRRRASQVHIPASRPSASGPLLAAMGKSFVTTTGGVMMQVEATYERGVDLVLCVDNSTQTLSVEDISRVTEEPEVVQASSEPSVLTIKQRAQANAGSLTSESTLVDSGTSMIDGTSEESSRPSATGRVVSNPVTPDRKLVTNKHERAVSVPSRIAQPSVQIKYPMSDRRRTLNAWGTTYMSPSSGPLPWPMPPSQGPLSLRPNQRSIELPSRASDSLPDGRERAAGSIAMTPIPSGPNDESGSTAHEGYFPADAQLFGSTSTVMPPSLPMPEPLSDKEHDGHGEEAENHENSGKLVPFDPNAKPRPVEEDDNHSMVSSVAQRRLGGNGGSSRSSLNSPPRRRGTQARRNKRHAIGRPNPGDSLPNLLQSAKSLASIRSLGSSAMLSEGSTRSRDEKSDKGIQSLTHTMVGSWFQKFNRHNRNPQLRYFWVNPYSRALNWASKPPSQGKKNMQTKTVFIVSLKWKDADRQYRNYPPGPEHAIVVQTPHREVRIVPTNWMDHEQWVTGLSLLLERTHRSLPLHEQFGIMDRDGLDGPETDLPSAHEHDAAPLDGSGAPVDTEMTLDDLVSDVGSNKNDAQVLTSPSEHNAIGLPRTPTGGLPQQKKTLIRRNSLWNSMQDLSWRNSSSQSNNEPPLPTVRPTGASAVDLTTSSSHGAENIRRRMSIGNMLRRQSKLPVPARPVAEALPILSGLLSPSVRQTRDPEPVESLPHESEYHPEPKPELSSSVQGTPLMRRPHEKRKSVGGFMMHTLRSLSNLSSEGLVDPPSSDLADQGSMLKGNSSTPSFSSRIAGSRSRSTSNLAQSVSEQERALPL